MMETGLIGVKQGVPTLESVPKSQPPSSGKKANVLNVDYISTRMTQLKFITRMEIIATIRWKT
jgi:hypothetical protein